MQQSTIWLSYDLGVKGDYDILYQWLDEHESKECGDSIAVLPFEYKQDLLDELSESLKGSIEFEDGNRIYVIYRLKGEQKVKGKFIVGRRKPAPWKGYAVVYEEDIEDA